MKKILWFLIISFVSVLNAENLPKYCQKDFNVETFFGMYAPTSVIDKQNADGEKVIFGIKDETGFSMERNAYKFSANGILENPNYRIECIKIYKEEGEVPDDRFTYFGGYGWKRDYIVMLWVSEQNSVGFEVINDYELWGGNGRGGASPYVKTTYQPEDIFDAYKIVEAEYKEERRFDYLLRFFALDELDRWLAVQPLEKKRLRVYNDIAYYLEQAKAYKESAYLLEKIVSKFPERTVAYINLGDAYWELGKQQEAKKAYRTYIDQMKTEGKASRIPKRVRARVSQ